MAAEQNMKAPECWGPQEVAKTFEDWAKEAAGNGKGAADMDKDRTNDRPQSSGLIREKIAKLSKQAQRDGAHKDMMASKIKELAERFNGSRERGRDEGRGR